jgi:glycosyltransferase involved in cell wall biosynthesis
VLPDPPPIRLLAVAHEASQTGAPTVLARFLEWAVASGTVEVQSLLLHGGALEPRFAALGPTRVVEHQAGAGVLELVERGLVARGSRRAWNLPASIRYRSALRHVDPYDAVYLNSLTTLEVLPYLPPQAPVIAHIHEVDVAIAGWRHGSLLQPGRRRPDRWIAVSDETRDALVGILGIDPADVIVRRPFIDVANTQAEPTGPSEVALRREAGIPLDVPIVMGSGTIEWRKGVDLFVQLANEVRRRMQPRPVHFVWVGGEQEGPEWLRLKADLRKAGADHVHIVGHVADPRRWYRAATVFALTSREDPFPLVCLEQAAMGHPIVAYDSSGIRGLLAEAGPAASAGIHTYLDVGSMADHVVRLIDDTSARRAMGDELAAAVERGYDVETAAPLLVAELQAVDSNRP